MAFGAELRDFVVAFDKGYKMIKSAQETAEENEDKNYVRKQRAWAEEDRAVAAKERPLRLQALQTGIDAQRVGMEATRAGIDNTRSLTEARQYDLELKKQENSPNTAFQSGVEAIATGSPAAQPASPPSPSVAPASTPEAVPTGDGYSFAPVAKPTSAQSAITEMVTGKPGDYVGMGHDQVKDALNFLANDSGMATPQGVPTPESKNNTRQVLQGKFRPASNEDVMAVLDKVRKNLGKDATDEEVGMKAFGAIREYYMKVGQPELGNKAAADLLQYYQSAYNKYSAIAAAAAQDGNTQAAVNAAVKAYANIPDGKDMKAVKNKDGSYNVTFNDLNTGKTVERHVLTPEQIGSMALKLGNPAVFSQAILSAAGVRKQDNEATPAFKTASAALKEGELPPVDPAMVSAMSKDEQDRYFKLRENMSPKGITPENMKNVREEVDTGFDAKMLNLEKNPAVAKFIGDNANEIKRIASNVMANNKNVMGQDAIETVMDMFYVDQNKPMIMPGKVLSRNKDNVTVKIDNRPAVTMSMTDYDKIAELWTKATQPEIEKLMKIGAAAKAENQSKQRWDRANAISEQTLNRDLGIARESVIRSQGIPEPEVIRGQ